jgi:pilus assembly protein CpaF
VDARVLVETEVRELVRQRGIDPWSDAPTIRALVGDVIADYEDRSASGAMPLLLDPQSVARQVYDAVAGLGPLQPFLDDPQVEEIWINEPGRVFVARRGRSELTTAILDDATVRDLVERMLAVSGRRIDLSTPFVDAMLADGSRLHVVIPDVTRRHWAVNIRKFVVGAHSLEQLVGLDAMPPAAADFLTASVVAGLTSSSPAAPRRGRRRCSTASPLRSRPMSGSSPARRSSSCDCRSQTSWQCRPASPASRARARSGCAGSSRRRCECDPTASSSARSDKRKRSTC